MESQYTLLLGFSYSLRPDGGPGSYNRDIAADIRKWVSENSDATDHLLLAAQWEIVDALGPEYVGPDPFAAPPPLFDEDDIPDADGFIRLLKKGETAGARELALTLRNVLHEVGYESDEEDENTVFDHASPNATRLAIYLNRLLNDNTFYKRFRPNVELHDLHRPELGALGFEKREMPAEDGPLLPYQTIRVNRLIIESIVPSEDILKRGTYLSTRGVLEHVLAHFEDKLMQIQRVLVFGFPVHSPRCRRQTIESFWKAGRHIDPKHVADVRYVERSKWDTLQWDENTAQIWCRSLENWLDYEKMGQRRL